MNVIVGLSKLMEHEINNPEKLKEYLQKIQTSSNHLLGREISIIAMTANAFADDIQQSIDVGMNAHISKPMDLKMLARTMKSLKK